MSFTTSINIERDFGKTPHYIVTANARQTIGKIINHFASGIHSFCLIGSYGTGNPASSSPWKTVCVERLLEKMSY